MLRRIYYWLPPSLRMLVRRLWFLPADLLQILSSPNSLVPPRGLIYTGSGDFIKVGQIFLRYFRDYGGLQPSDHVLDVGCGIGRMAAALTGYLSKEGRYDGFDVVPTGIRWCQKRITPKFPNFHFRHVDLENDLYTVSDLKAEHYTFPYPDATFELAIVISVFTHMTRAAMVQYLDQIHRVLKDDGRLFATFFLLNTTSRELMRRQRFRFDYADDGCYLMDIKVKSANVAYDEGELGKMLSQAGFSLQHTLYGRWSGRQDGVLDFQDILVLRKCQKPGGEIISDP